MRTAKHDDEENMRRAETTIKNGIKYVMSLVHPLTTMMAIMKVTHSPPPGAGGELVSGDTRELMSSPQPTANERAKLVIPARKYGTCAAVPPCPPCFSLSRQSPPCSTSFSPHAHNELFFVITF